MFMALNEKKNIFITQRMEFWPEVGGEDLAPAESQGLTAAVSQEMLFRSYDEMGHKCIVKSN